MTDDNQQNIHPLNREGGDFNKLAEKLGGYDKAQEAMSGWRTPPGPGEIHDTPMGKFMREAVFADAHSDEAKTLYRDYPHWCNNRYDQDIDGKPWQHHFEPRRIVPPGGYATPKFVSSMLISHLLEVTIKDRLGMAVAPVEITNQLIAYNVLKYQVPIYYVSEALLRSVAATKIPGDYLVGEIKLPVKALALGLPPKFMKEFTGREVPYVMCCDADEGDHRPPAWLADVTFNFCGVEEVRVGKRPQIGAPSKMCFWFNTWNAKEGLPEAFVTSWYKKDRIADIGKLYGYTDYTMSADTSKLDEDKAVSEKVTGLLLKLFAVLNLRPALLKQATMRRPAQVNRKTGHTEKSELWNANMIGENYQIPKLDAPTGTHASPHWHIRGGHVVLQRIGSLNSPDFVSVKTLARYEDTHEIDWTKVDEETKARFWRSHKRILLDSTLVNWDEETMGPPPPSSEE